VNTPAQAGEITTDTLSRPELIALACSIGLVPLNSTMLAVAIPSIAVDLRADAGSLMQWLVASYLVVSIVAQNPAGKLSDRWGYARALALGQLVFAAGSVIGFWGAALHELVAARVMMAVGGAIIVPAAMATLRIRLPQAERAKAFGSMGAVMGLSAAIGPLVGGEVAHRLGWPALFLVNVVPLAIAAALGLWRRSPRVQTAPRAAARFDVIGSVLLGVGLALVVFGMRAASGAMPLILAGAATLVAFAAWERRAADPVIDLQLFTRPGFAAATSIIAFQNFAMYALLFELPLVLAQAFGTTSAESGRTLLGLTLAMMAGSLAGGRVAAQRGSRNTAIGGAAAACAGGVMLAVIPLASPAAAIPALLTLGVGLGLTTPAANAVSMSAARADESGMASAVSGTMRYLGGIAGIAVVSTVVSQGDLLAAHRRSAFIFAASLALAMGVALLIPRSNAPGAAE
jgi:MFS family permease